MFLLLPLTQVESLSRADLIADNWPISCRIYSGLMLWTYVPLISCFSYGLARRRSTHVDPSIRWNVCFYPLHHRSYATVTLLSCDFSCGWGHSCMRPCHNNENCPASAAPSQATPSKDTDFQQALGILKQAARSKSVPGHLVVEAMIKLGKQNLAVSSPDVICLGTSRHRQFNNPCICKCCMLYDIRFKAC